MATLQLTGAVATSENVVTLTFSEAVYFSGLLDAKDASARARYAIAPVAGTIGRDGSAARPVGVVGVEQAVVGGLSAGQALALTLDRPMTPYPAQYTVTCNGLWSANLADSLDPTHASFTFLAVAPIMVVPSTINFGLSRGDIANPQVQSAAVAAGIPSSLGTFGVDETGDYAVDVGLDSYKKRVLRRIISQPGAFAHLPLDFGVGISSYGKKLATAQRKADLAAALEKNIAADPETQSVSVTIESATSPYLFRVRVKCTTKAGQQVGFSAPVG